MKKANPYIIFLCFAFLLAANLQAVVVSTVGELVNAVENANNGGDKTIILRDGTYALDDMLAIWTDGITVKSQSGNRDKVTIRGQGMYGGVSHLFNVPGSNFTVKDMTIGWVSNHAIQVWGNNNSSNILISNLHIVDTYEQMVKISYDSSSSNSSENGVMENCLLEYSAGVGPQYYIGGIDGHQTKNWTVRNNTFKNISSPGGDVAEHAVHFWSDSQDTLVENNLIINCDRGIGFGLGNRGHVRGVIRNNMIYHDAADSGFADVAIGLENAYAAQVYNNTIYIEHSYPYAIEYRFSGTSGGIIKNNLCNKTIASRDGGSASLGSNIENARKSWFVNVSSGDLHLASAISQVVDQGVSIAGLSTDFDGHARPQGSGVDIGADEYASSGGGGSDGHAEPFGAFDTPVDGSTVRSSIAVTGWALDDVSVKSVKIYRGPVPGAETGLIYIGAAVFVEGARPDIEAAYPGYPGSSNAGWGYMMLTNFLPNGGNGAFTFYAIASDGSGNQVTLGSKTVTCDNAHAVKPFGAIDTPTQGGTASGSGFINWGWVLAPPPNKIPTSGSTINVIVDGVNIGHPAYNIYRSDIAALFPGYANSSGAIGYFYLDTTGYEDGVHTIQWTAKDNNGSTDGIGSRYFTIQNNAGRTTQTAKTQAKMIYNDLDRVPTDSRHPVLVKKDYDENIEPEVLYPGNDGMITIEIKEMQRVVIDFGEGVVNPSALPIGSTLDSGKGIFYWQPGAGFLGQHRLVFVKKQKPHERVMVNIIIGGQT